MSPAPPDPAPAGRGLGALVAAGVGFTCSWPRPSACRPSEGIDQVPLPGGADLGDHPYEITAEFGDVLSLAPQSVRQGQRRRRRPGHQDLAHPRRLDRQGHHAGQREDRPARQRLRPPRTVQPARREVRPALAPEQPAPPRAHSRTATGSRSPAPTATRRSKRSSAPCRCSSTAAGSASSRPSPPSSTRHSPARNRRSARCSTASTPSSRTWTTTRRTSPQALDGVNRLSATLATRKQDVGTVLTGLSPGLKVLEKQRGSLLTMLRSLDSLSTVAVDTINKSKADMIADLKAIAPTLTALADSGDDLPDSLQVLFTYPFTDEVLRGVKGDYLNVYLDVTAQPGTQIIPALTPATHRPRRPARGRQPGAALPLPLPSVTTPGTEAPADDHPRHPAQEHRLPRHRRPRPRLPRRRGTPTSATTSGCATTTPSRSQLPQTGGLFTHSNVTYRGVSVGRVGPIELTDDGVEAELRIENDAPPIPDSLRGRRRQPLRRRRAVHRPAAHPRGRALPRRTARSSTRPTPRSPRPSPTSSPASTT